MTPPPLWDRLRRARIVQVLGVYLGASWLVLQLVATLMDLLELPAWLGPVTLTLLGIGLVVVTATAWVQSLDSTTKAEEAGERPTDWEVAPADALASLKAGRFPALTWGRALVGGIVALSLAIGAAGTYVLLTGGPSLIGPAPLGAGEPRTAVVILPFQARGDALEVYGEGMVDLLAGNLNGLGGLRTVDPGTTIARWRSDIGEDFTGELDEALGVAGDLGARYAVRGSLVPIGDQVRITADVFDLDTREQVDGVRAEGPVVDLLSLVEGLSVDLARVFVGRSAEAGARTAVSTRSLSALESYLRGEAHYRRGDFPAAVAEFDQALSADSAFALAAWRLSESWGWIPTDGAVEGSAAANEIALRHIETLAPRERLLVEADAELSKGPRDMASRLRAHLTLNPDDADAQNLLAEYLHHVPWASEPGPGEMVAAFDRLVELVPTFPPYYIHPLHLAVDKNDEDRFRRYLAAYEANGADPEVVRAARHAWGYYRGDADGRAAAEAYITQAPLDVLSQFLLGYGMSDDLAPNVRAGWELRLHQVVPPTVFPAYLFSNWAGLGPEVAGVPLSRAAYGAVSWALAAGPPNAMPSVVLDAVAQDTSISTRSSAAMLAAMVGDDALADELLAMLADADFEGQEPVLGVYYGSASLAEVQANVAALRALRMGDGPAAADAMSAVASVPAYDPITRVIVGDARMAAGDIEGALEQWDPMIDSVLRPAIRIRQGRGREALGDTARALEAYRGHLTMWSAADPELATKREAMAALERLGN